MRIPISILAFIVLVTFLAATASAEKLPSKKELWLGATEVIINGKKMPTIFDIQGGPEAEKKLLAKLMADNSLPKGWQPIADCQQEDYVDLSEVISKLAKNACTTSEVKKTASTISGNLKCATEQGPIEGTVSVSGIGSLMSTYNAKMKGNFQGMPIDYKGTTVYKYVGSDCSKAPAGI